MATHTEIVNDLVARIRALEKSCAAPPTDYIFSYDINNTQIDEARTVADIRRDILRDVLEAFDAVPIGDSCYGLSFKSDIKDVFAILKEPLWAHYDRVWLIHAGKPSSGFGSLSDRKWVESLKPCS
jgi:hypothetical protein